MPYNCYAHAIRPSRGGQESAAPPPPALPKKARVLLHCAVGHQAPRPPAQFVAARLHVGQASPSPYCTPSTPPTPPGLKQPAFQALTVSSRRQWCGGPASLSCSCISAALSTSALVPCMGALVACSSTCTSSLPASFCSSFMSGSWARSCVPRRLDRPCDCTQQWRQHTQDTCLLDVSAVGCSPLLCYM